jgi:integrase
LETSLTVTNFVTSILAAMASVHIKSGSPFWYAWFRNAKGQRVSKTTTLRWEDTPKTKAQKMGDEMERLAQRARQGLLTESKAREWVSEAYEMTSGRPLVFHSVESWLRGWLEDKSASKAKATASSYRTNMESFIAHLGERAKLGIEQITPRDITTYRDSKVKAGNSPQTANQAVKQLRIPFNLARKQGLIPSNPAEAVDALPSVSAERETFTGEQVKALIATAAAHGAHEWVGAILFGFFTGQRLTDISNLRWENIELAAEGPHLRLTQRKTKKVVTVPLAKELADWLLSIPASDDPQAFVFPALAGRGTGGAHGLSGRFSDLMDKAGIPRGDARKNAGKGRNLSALSFHSLRHTFTSMLANEGVSSEIRQKLTGHASEAVHRKYTHHDMDKLREAIEVLPSLKTSGSKSNRAKQ